MVGTYPGDGCRSKASRGGGLGSRLNCLVISTCWARTASRAKSTATWAVSRTNTETCRPTASRATSQQICRRGSPCRIASATSSRRSRWTNRRSRS